MSKHHKTLVELLQLRVAEHSDATLFTFLLKGGEQEQVMTYRGLDERARAIAVAILRVCQPGDRALLLYAPGLEYIASFFGCLYAGVIPVPAYPPNPARLEQTLPKIVAIRQDCDAAVILATADIALMRAAAPGLDVAWLATDALTKSGEGWAPPSAGPDDIAFVQYTSGSTGSPKGVMLRHRNLVANLDYIARQLDIGPSSVIVGWLPPYHDMGLIGTVLETVHAGCTGVLMAPMAFLQKPIRWLQAISKYRGTHGAAPNFAYDMCLRRVTPEQIAALDLSSWRSFVNGAEPIRPSTMKAFHDTFGAAARWQAAPELTSPCVHVAPRSPATSWTASTCRGARERQPPPGAAASRG